MSKWLNSLMLEGSVGGTIVNWIPFCECEKRVLAEVSSACGCGTCVQCNGRIICNPGPPEPPRKVEIPVKKYHAYIGRWQSPHKGHRWLIDQHLAKNELVLIMIRDVKVDENNPFTAWEVLEMLKSAFKNEMYGGLVRLQIIPDIASVNYGRGVGYDVVCHEAAAPEHVKRISATDIRTKIRAGDDSWRDMVMPGTETFLEMKFNEGKVE